MTTFGRVVAAGRKYGRQEAAQSIFIAMLACFI